MHRRAFTLLEVVLTILLLGFIIAFVFPDLSSEKQARSLIESSDRLRSLIAMSHAEAMQSGLRYRIAFPGTPDPLDRTAQKEIDVPAQTLQPTVQRQNDPLNNPESYGDFDAEWKSQEILMEGTRCVAVLPGRPAFEISGSSPIAGPSIAKNQAVFVPLTINPDGSCDWVTFVLTDLPLEIEEPLSEHATRIYNVIVDGRTGQAWIQRALRVEEVEVMNEHGASPILHMDFTSGDMITEDNILEIRIVPGGSAQTSQVPQEAAPPAGGAP